MRVQTVLNTDTMASIVVFLVALTCPFVNFYFYSLFLPAFGLLLITGQLHFSRTGRMAWVLLTLLTLSYLLGLINAIDITAGLTHLKFIVYCFLLMIFMSGVIVVKGIRAAELILDTTAAITLVAALLSLAGFYNLLPISDYVVFAGYRVMGFSGNPNPFGAELCFTALYLYYKLDTTRALSRKAMIFSAIFILLITLLLTYSRGAWIAMVIGVVTYAAFDVIRKRTTTALFWLLAQFIAFAAITILIWTIVQIYDPNQVASQRLQLADYDQERFMLHAILWEQALQNPLGMGPGQSIEYLRHFYNNITTGGSSHQTYLGALYEAGWIGALSFISLMIYITWAGIRLAISNWQYARLAGAVTATLFGFLIIGMVNDLMPYRYLWVITGIIAGLNILYVHNASPFKTLRAAPF